MKIFSKIKSWWNIHWIAKRANSALVVSFLVTDARVRLQFSFPKFGADKDTDSSISKAWVFFAMYGPDAGADAHAERPLNTKALKIYQWFCNDALAKKDFALCTRIMHLKLTAENHPQTASRTALVDVIANDHQLFYKAKLVPIGIFALWKESAVLIRRLISAWSSLSKSQMRLINIKLEYVVPFIATLLGVSAVAGFLYAYIVYGHFGIQVTQFFTLDDYLAANIEEIWDAFIAISLYPIAVLIMYRRGIQFGNDFVFMHFRKLPVLTLVLLIPAISFFVLLGFSYVYSWDVFWLLIPFSVYFVLQTSVARIAARNCQNPFLVTAIAMLILIFSASVGSQSWQRIENIKNGHEQNAFVVETAEKIFTEEQYVFLGANQLYIFLLKKGGVAEIIPLERIKRMNTIDSKTWRLPFFR